LQPSIRATPLAKTEAVIFFSKLRCVGIIAGLTVALFAATAGLRAQSIPTATEPLHISVFAGATGRQTYLGGGRNGDFTAGVDLGLRPYRFLRPSLEIRGTTDIDKGHIDGQKDVLGGIKLEAGGYHRLHPYIDFLAGRAGITYAKPGALVPGTSILYTSSSTTALDGGGGFDYDITRHIAFKADSQLLRLSTPVTPGHLHPYEVTIGASYRFGGGWAHPKRHRHDY
jgi:hypothetical protein